METGLSKSRRPLLLVFIAVGCLVVIWRVAVWHNRTRASQDAAPVSRDYHSEVAEVAAEYLRARVKLSNGPALVDTNVPLPTPEEPATNTLSRWITLVPAPPIGNAFLPPGSLSYAVVDLGRLLAAHPASTNSPEARMAMIARIKEVVAVRAAAHHYTFVFDVAATASANTPFILTAEEVPDLTDEVLTVLAP